MNGAVGISIAHAPALPRVDWPALSAAFGASLGLHQPSHYPIEPHDWIAEYCHALMRANTGSVGFRRDMWSYISMGLAADRSRVKCHRYVAPHIAAEINRTVFARIRRGSIRIQS